MGIKQKPCSFCKKEGHQKLNCYAYQKTKPRGKTTTIKPLKQRLGKKYHEDLHTRQDWVYKHGGIYATWECYLRISPMCLRILNINTLALDHIKPKGTNRELRHDLNNLKPSCAPCNGLKGSSSLEYLSEKYPDLKIYL